MDKIHYSSKTDEHYTPDHVLDAVVRCLGAIDLDPCSNADHNVPAANHFTKLDDGLAQEWHGRVFMNPPYGKKKIRHIKPWIAKLVDEYYEGRVTEAIALIPARPDTQWFRLLRNYPKLFVTGRLTFKGNDNPAGFPSALAYLGSDRRKFVDVFVDFGDVYERVIYPDQVEELEEIGGLDILSSKHGRKGGGGGWVELKTINGCGPYAYKRWREGGRMRSEYIGKVKE